MPEYRRTNLHGGSFSWIGVVLMNTVRLRQSLENESDKVWCVERTLRLWPLATASNPLKIW
jgi:hypothetical protein